MAKQPESNNPQAERRNSHISTTYSEAESDIFSDEHALDSFAVADGYQPSTFSQNLSPHHLPSRSNSKRSISQQPAVLTSPDVQKKKIPNNVQALGPRNSFSLRHDAQFSDPPRRMTSVSSISAYTEASTSRPFSALSRMSLSRPQSTYAGSSAPSHPYGMYPQDTSINRTSSTSTYRPSPERAYTGPDRPTHPYGMYPQNTVNEAELDPLASSTDIASVGFPGLRQQYARRLGPDGEEADDIIGPDGHSEQLPPYTRYPDAGPLPRKQTSLQPEATPMLPSPVETPQASTSGVSVTDALLVPARSEEATRESFERRTEKNWAQKSKRRTCFGTLPVWVVVILIFILVALAAALGGVIGSSLSRRGRADHTSMGDTM
jgi:hypothetical protein